MVKKFYRFISENRRDIIPPGFLFRPTDEMLIDILALKNTNRSMPCVIIPEIELYEIHPRQLSESHHHLELDEWFLFTRLDEKNPGSKYANRVAHFGYWKVSSVDEHIISDGGVNG